MTSKPFHLAWFTNFGIDEWNDAFASGGTPWSGELYIDIAKALERACFDYIMFDDNLLVPEAYGGSAEAYLRLGVMAPKHDPAPLAALIGSATSHLGVVITLSTLAYPPYLLARLCSTLDHICGGRFGWNIVNSSENGAAQNFGKEVMPPRDERYEMAEEYMDLVGQLFRSWDRDAVIRDRNTDTYADYRKVRPVNFKGKYFNVRGPLNTAPSPQGRPTYVQAGASPVGRAFAAKHSDCVVVAATGISAMKSFRDDIRARAAASGRDPEKVKVFFVVAPVLGETKKEARAKYDQTRNSLPFLERTLAFVSSVSDIDFAQFELDKPLSKLSTNGGSGAMDKFVQWGSGKTLRELTLEGYAASIELIGTPDEVSAQMGDVMEEVGGDGFIITAPFHRVSRRYVDEITEGLVPALQRRGLTRKTYATSTLRDTLTEF
jgi:FMN-dependent oxidoreductase (nitrilotriacetate monooxygenase family)